MLKRIYVAGPYSANPEECTYKAMAAADQLLRLGFASFLPHLTLWWEPRYPRHYETWMAWDFAWLAQCEALLRLPGHSPGADREVVFATEHGIPVYASIADLLRSQLNPVNHCVVLVGPSASGKTLLKDTLVESGAFRYGVTCTTRPPRPGEVNGRDYDFLTAEEYRIAGWNGDLAESTTYVGNGTRYGILQSRVGEAKAADVPTVWILDVNGLNWMRAHFPGQTVGICLSADRETLRWRMQQRGTSETEAEGRLAKYDEELDKAHLACDAAIDTRNLTPEQVCGRVLALLEV